MTKDEGIMKTKTQTRFKITTVSQTMLKPTMPSRGKSSKKHRHLAKREV